MLRILIADDHQILRDGLLLLLDRTPDIVVIGEASDGEEAISKTEELVPDVVLMDITMPGLSGLEASRQIVKCNQNVKILLLTVHESDEYLVEMLNIRLAGYILKSASGREVITAIRAVHRGDIYLYKGNLVEAEKEYQKLFELEEQKARRLGRERLGALYLLQVRFEESKNKYHQGIELAEKAGEMEWKSWHHYCLSYLYLRSGNPEDALIECNEALNSAIEWENLSMQRLALHMKGLSYVEMKSLDEAQKTADELKELIENGKIRKAMRLYYNLMGIIELERENFTEAIEYFNQALTLMPSQYNPDHGQVLFIDPLAFAYYKAGDYEKAKQEYERIIHLTTGRLYYGDMFAKSFYLLGKICEQQGQKNKAIERYEKFLDLWKDADPGIPEVEDAKKRLARLQKS